MIYYSFFGIHYHSRDSQMEMPDGTGGSRKRLGILSLNVNYPEKPDKVTFLMDIANSQT